ncbi:MAG: hypothetical protein ACLUQX_06030 [Thomasclavelia spiroformis]
MESLIRKAYLVAKKLKLKEFEEWLNQEQNGYKKEIRISKYYGRNKSMESHIMAGFQ